MRARHLLLLGVLLPGVPAAAPPAGLEATAAVLTRYDDNVFRLSAQADPRTVLDTAHTDDLMRTTLASLGTTFTPGRQRVSLAGQVQHTAYDRFDFLDHTGWQADARWDLEIGPRLSGRVEGARARRLESFTEFRDPVLDLVDTSGASARLRWAVNARLGAGARTASRRLRHGLDVRRDGDSRSDELGVFADYRAPSGNRVGLELDRQDYGSPRREFTAASLTDNAYRQYRVQAIADWTGGGRGALQAQAGYTWRRFDHLDTRDSAGPSGRVKVNWQWSAKTAFEARAYREFTAVEELFASAVVRTGADVAVTWQPTWRQALRVYGAYDRRRFAQDPGVLPGFAFTQPTEVLRTVGATWTWAPREWMRLALGYDHGRRTSDRAFFDFEYEAVFVNLEVML